ncbi:MAG TPA: hypothetical protein VKA07_14015 [Candidatus Sulfotelmatobacter sp.]|nr:hypothetical protein [Candidatus Sulfotelmatobacter sp.]
MTPELQRALKNHQQWFGSYKKPGDLVKVQVWLTVNAGQIEFLTPGNSYKVKRARRHRCVISFVGSPNGPAIWGTAEIISDRHEVPRVYRRYWKIHPIFMLLGVGLRVWIGMLMNQRVVVRIQPDEPNPLAGITGSGILRHRT